MLKAEQSIEAAQLGREIVWHWLTGLIQGPAQAAELVGVPGYVVVWGRRREELDRWWPLLGLEYARRWLNHYARATVEGGDIPDFFEVQKAALAERMQALGIELVAGLVAVGAESWFTLDRVQCSRLQWLVELAATDRLLPVFFGSGEGGLPVDTEPLQRRCLAAKVTWDAALDAVGGGEEVFPGQAAKLSWLLDVLEAGRAPSWVLLPDPLGFWLESAEYALLDLTGGVAWPDGIRETYRLRYQHVPAIARAIAEARRGAVVPT